MKTKLIVQAGQYEQAAEIITVNHKTADGLWRRARQLSTEHAVHGDNHAGWIKASVAIASPSGDRWEDNSIIGGRHCIPRNGWLDLWQADDDPARNWLMTYNEMVKVLGL